MLNSETIQVLHGVQGHYEMTVPSKSHHTVTLANKYFMLRVSTCCQCVNAAKGSCCSQQRVHRTTALFAVIVHHGPMQAAARSACLST